jgi:hypothetical protein
VCFMWTFIEWETISKVSADFAHVSVIRNNSKSLLVLLRFSLAFASRIGAECGLLLDGFSAYVLFS